jgi:hypothetical protein
MLAHLASAPIHIKQAQVSKLRWEPKSQTTSWAKQQIKVANQGVVGKRCIAEWGGDESQRFGIPPKQLRRQGEIRLAVTALLPAKQRLELLQATVTVCCSWTPLRLFLSKLCLRIKWILRERERRHGIDRDRERMAKTIASCSTMLRTTLSIPRP